MRTSWIENTKKRDIPILKYTLIKKQKTDECVQYVFVHNNLS